MRKRIVLALCACLFVALMTPSVTQGKSQERVDTEKRHPVSEKNNRGTPLSLDVKPETNQISPAESTPDALRPGASTPASPNYRLSGELVNWSVFSSAGSTSSSANNTLTGSAGQTAVGESSSQNFDLLHGFWHSFEVSAGCCGLFTGGFTGNTDCDTEGKTNLADVTKLIDRIYLSKTPLCCEANGNVDGDIENKLNLADITRLIDHIYLSKAPTATCL